MVSVMAISVPAAPASRAQLPHNGETGAEKRSVEEWTQRGFRGRISAAGILPHAVPTVALVADRTMKAATAFWLLPSS
jgi:hypothetical protein